MLGLWLEVLNKRLRIYMALRVEGAWPVRNRCLRDSATLDYFITNPWHLVKYRTPSGAQS